MDKEFMERWYHITEVISHVNFPGYTFHCRYWDNGKVITVHIEYEEPDVMSGVRETQHGRRWIIEPDATDMAIVQTCFKALMTSLEHRARENFTYKAKALMQPHYTLDDIVAIAPNRYHIEEEEPIDFGKSKSILAEAQA